MKNTKLFTVITGASRGLGKSMAFECAKEGKNLILISLPNPEVTRRMEKYNSFIKTTFLSPSKTAKILIKETLEGKTIRLYFTLREARVLWMLNMLPKLYVMH